MQSDMVLEGPRFLHFDPEEVRKKVFCRQLGRGSILPWAELKHRTSPTPTVPYFLQQGHIYSNKLTPPDRATSCGLSILNPPHSLYMQKQNHKTKTESKVVICASIIVYSHLLFSHFKGHMLASMSVVIILV